MTHYSVAEFKRVLTILKWPQICVWRMQETNLVINNPCLLYKVFHDKLTQGFFLFFASMNRYHVVGVLQISAILSDLLWKLNSCLKYQHSLYNPKIVVMKECVLCLNSCIQLWMNHCYFIGSPRATTSYFIDFPIKLLCLSASSARPFNNCLLYKFLCFLCTLFIGEDCILFIWIDW